MSLRRLSPVLVVLGLLLIAAGVACWLSGLDLPLHRAFRLATGSPWVRSVVKLSALGGFAVEGPIALAAVVLLLVRRRMADALWLFASVASGRIMVEGLKLLVLRPRPPMVDRLELVKSWSFPSSHSAGTMLTCLLLAAVFGRGAGAWVAALLAAAIIGWSRAALGVHWPGDVLAGWGCGMAWAGMAIRLRRSPPR